MSRMPSLRSTLRPSARSAARWPARVAILALAGCTFEGMPVTADGGPGGDLTASSGDAGEPAALSCANRVPTTGFGTTPGRTAADFTLQTCDGSDYSLYDEEFCEAELTVVVIAAGWCVPAIQMSMELEEGLTAAYADRGVRVLQVLLQTEDWSAPDLAYCQSWVERFELSNVVLVDPAQLTGRYLPDGALPSTLILDDRGVIRFRASGYDGLDSLTAAVDEVLGG